MAAPPLYGQITTIGSAQRLDPTDKAASAAVFILKAPASNTPLGIFVGDSSVTTGTGYQMDPGDQIVYERLQQQGAGTAYTTRVSDVWVWIPTANDKLTWIAFPGIA